MGTEVIEAWRVDPERPWRPVLPVRGVLVSDKTFRPTHVWHASKGIWHTVSSQTLRWPVGKTLFFTQDAAEKARVGRCDAIAVKGYNSYEGRHFPDLIAVAEVVVAKAGVRVYRRRDKR